MNTTPTLEGICQLNPPVPVRNIVLVLINLMNIGSGIPALAAHIEELNNSPYSHWAQPVLSALLDDIRLAILLGDDE